jgi:hypothetical protein
MPVWRVRMAEIASQLLIDVTKGSRARQAAPGIAYPWSVNLAALRSRVLHVQFGTLVYAVAALGAGALIGVIGAQSTATGFAAAIVLLAGMLVIGRPTGLAILAFVGVYFVQRLGGTSVSPGAQTGVSYSDALLAGAALMAVPGLIGTPEMRRIRGLLAAAGAYLLCLMPGIITHPSPRAYLEWAHRSVLIVGAIVVGAWITREHSTRLALRIFVAVSCVFGLLAIENWVRNGFHPASPLHLNKNFLGSQLAAALVVVVLVRGRIAVRNALWIAATLIVGVGLLCTESRGGELAAATGFVVAFGLSGRVQTRATKAVALLLAGVLAAFTYSSVHAELTRQTTSELNTSSLGVRFNVEKVTRQIWGTSPIVGVGLKYYYETNIKVGRYGYYAQAPDNIVDNELAESGVIGLAGFVVMEFGMLVVAFRRRKDHALILAGMAVVAGALVHGQVDIFWTAGSAALPFIIIGMGLAMPPPSRRDHPANTRQRVEDVSPQTLGSPVPEQIGAHRPIE